MDLRAYYKKVRDTEASLAAPQVVLVSLATPDGGKAGVVSEVPTPVAARMIVEGRARTATEAETSGFHEENAAQRKAAQEAEAISKVQVVVVPASAVKPSVRSGKEQ